MVVLHSITTFYPLLGVLTTHHPATGVTIAFAGKAGQPGTLPLLVHLPLEALDDAQNWPAATNTDIVATDDNDHLKRMNPLY